MSIEIKGNEVFKDGEKVGYLTDPENHLRMTRVHAELRDEVEEFINKVSDMPNGDPGDPDTAILPPEGEGFAAHETKDVGNPPVPATKPLQSGGRGKYDPPFFWWAWNQPESDFRSIYGITQSEFSKGENGGYVDKVKQVLQSR